jgi:hypothetical protein
MLDYSTILIALTSDIGGDVDYDRRSVEESKQPLFPVQSRLSH